MRTTYRTASAMVLMVMFAVSLAACGGGSSGSGSQTLVIGATLPLTGPLGSIGILLQTGYTRAVSEVNASGGLAVGGTKYKIQLIILDDKSDPDTATQQARTLFLQDNAVALLGSATPALNIPISNIAEQVKRPLVQSIAPLEAWLHGRQGGWNYAWDMFFDENQQTDIQFQTSDLVKTDKRVALFTDTEEDGITQGNLWVQKAPQFGYQISYHTTFPVGTTNFSSQIAAAKSAQADIVIAQMIPTDGAALWKQMKSLSYQPKLVFCEKCAGGDGWIQLLGSLGDGAMAADWWSPSLGLPQTSEFVTAYGKKYSNSSLSGIVMAYSVVRVVCDAISQAGSLDPNAINSAIGTINKTYPTGHIQFRANRTAVLQAVEDQWQGMNTARVYPATQGAASIETPVPGLG